MVFNGELEGRGKKGKKRKKGKKGKKERGGIHDFRFRGRGKYHLCKCTDRRGHIVTVIIWG
jgi:hypothetical protein